MIFPLEEVRQFKIQKLQNELIMNTNQNMMMNMNNPMILTNFQNNIQNINTVNCDDCFEYNQKMEYYTGENAMYCNNCKNQLPAFYQTILFTSPDILIIVLNRGKGIEFNGKMEFSETLNLYKYVERKETGYMYKLIGTVNHMGGSNTSDHFIACCKSPINNKWYKYNDDLVTEINNFNQEIINYAKPFILFYQKLYN